MVVFLLTSHDFESISYDRECIFNSLLKKMIETCWALPEVLEALWRTRLRLMMTMMTMKVMMCSRRWLQR